MDLEAVLFDLDNTAYAYDSCHHSGLRAAYEAALRNQLDFRSFEEFLSGYDESRKLAKKLLVGKAAGHCRLLYFKRLFEKKFGHTLQHETMVLHDAYWDGYFNAMIREPGSRELLDGLKKKGIPTAWVTNFTTERQFQKLERLGLADCVDFLVTSEEVGAEKPSPEVIETALEHFGISSSSRIILVGDNESEDGGAAARAGISFIWYRRSGVEIRSASSALFVVESWRQLGELLL